MCAGVNRKSVPSSRQRSQIFGKDDQFYESITHPPRAGRDALPLQLCPDILKGRERASVGPPESATVTICQGWLRNCYYSAKGVPTSATISPTATITQTSDAAATNLPADRAGRNDVGYAPADAPSCKRGWNSVATSTVARAAIDDAAGPTPPAAAPCRVARDGKRFQKSSFCVLPLCLCRPRLCKVNVLD
jgi:hypothetical protein